MKLTHNQKILVALATAWVLAYPLLFFGVVFLFTLGMAAMLVDDPTAFPGFVFAAILPLHCLTIIVQIALMAFYLAHVIKNTTASDTARIILGVGSFFMPYVAMPIYFYFFIWREDPPEWGRAVTPL